MLSVRWSRGGQNPGAAGSVPRASCVQAGAAHANAACVYTPLAAWGGQRARGGTQRGRPTDTSLTPKPRATYLWGGALEDRAHGHRWRPAEHRPGHGGCRAGREGGAHKAGLRARGAKAHAHGCCYCCCYCCWWWLWWGSWSFKSVRFLPCLAPRTSAYTRTHTHMYIHAHAHARTHARTHTHASTAGSPQLPCKDDESRS